MPGLLTCMASSGIHINKKAKKKEKLVSEQAPPKKVEKTKTMNEKIRGRYEVRMVITHDIDVMWFREFIRPYISAIDTHLNLIINRCECTF